MKIPSRVFGYVLFLGAAAGFFWIYPPNPWTWMQTLGLCLMVVGFPFWLMAHIQLGSSFSVAAKARTLVTRGLYSNIRNPIYIFGLIAIAGGFLFVGRPYLLLVFAILIPTQIVRMRKEARVLEEKFGEQYREYRRGTWF
jgi:protein-S-isoprenylcysteine O-methyltransferase Ste14